MKTPPLWINSNDCKCSYRRVYKAASSTIVNMLGIHNENDKPFYEKQFTVIRDPIGRAVSIYNQLSRYKNEGTFEEFLQRIKTGGMWDAHQQTQTWFIGGNEIPVFTVGQLQNVADLIGYTKDIPVLNPSKSYIDITPDARALILDIYAEDVELYNRTVSNCIIPYYIVT